MKTALNIRKPSWLNKKISFRDCGQLQQIFNELRLHTVCQEARCPNIGECFAAKVATFLILGRVCTRGCMFCGIAKGTPAAVDKAEPQRIAEAVAQLGLKHAVITSVTRDDLADGGAGAFVDTIKALRNLDENITVEVLVPDFEGKYGAVGKVICAKPDIFAHNIETVPSMYKTVRPAADSVRSLNVLKEAKGMDNRLLTKSGLMLGLGEREDEVLDIFHDLRSIDCDFLSIGQYLAPTSSHIPVAEFVRPEKFLFYKEKALNAGFRHVESGPYVRSSYIASHYITKERV